MNKRTKYPQLLDRDWLKSELDTKSYRQIAHELGTSVGNVADFANRHGIRNYSTNKSEAIKIALKRRYPNGRFGEIASNWRGGKQTVNGYLAIHSPNHPKATTNKRVFEHILVAEEKIGRSMLEDEVVHHINGNRKDNRPENLEVMLRSDHVRLHFASGNNINYVKNLETKLREYQEKYDKLTLESADKGVSTRVSKSIDDLLKEKSGIRLDIGCGKNKQPGFVGIDYRDWGSVDIVHDLEDTPWPLPDNCVLTSVASHVLEHINPHGGVFLKVMDEIWRIMQPDGQFAFVVPYAGSPGYWQDPTHVNGITESTLLYFDPDPEGKYAGQTYYQFYEPKPWKIEKLAYNTNGNLECVLRKRIDDKSYHQDPINDVVQEVSSNARVEEVKKYFSDKY